MFRIRVSIILLFVTVFCLADRSFCAESSIVDISSYIPLQSSLTVNISKVENDTWTPAANLEFGNLVYDETNKIFTASAYFAVDVEILANTATWSVVHSCSSLSNGIDTLDNNINVTFVHQKDKDTGEEIEKLSYAASNGKSLSKSKFPGGGWLRIYYGIATGETTKDAPGVTPIISGNTAGNYKGNINLTLTS